MPDDPNNPPFEQYVARYAARIARWPQIDAFNLLRDDVHEERAAIELLRNAFKEAARRVLAAEPPLPEQEEFRRELAFVGWDAPIKVPKPQAPAVVVPFPKNRKGKPRLRVVGNY